MKHRFLFLVTALIFSIMNLKAAETLRHLVFTYMGDPSTSLTANWQWLADDPHPQPSEALVQYDVVSRRDAPEAYAMQTRGQVFSIPGLNDRVLARVELEDLKPGTTYYTEEMVTPDGYSIPMVLAIGNHEVHGSFGQSKQAAPFFFGFFGQDPEKSYFKRQFGPQLALFVLDSGHVASHESQVDWLDQELEASKEIPYKAAIYHVPLYPSHRDFMGTYSDLGRAHWAPVFDAHGLTVAFENHDHTFKRSHFIKNGEKVPNGEGTLYLGDGCWGRDARPVDEAPLWYLNKQGAIQHFWVVDCTVEQMTYRAVDMENRVFDIYPDAGEDTARASEVFASTPGLYKLPEGVIASTLDLVQNPAWKGGELETILRNPFAHPVEIWMQPLPERINFTVEGLPAFPLKLMPGEVRKLGIVWTPKEAITTLPENLELSYNIQLKQYNPDQKTPSAYAGKTGVKILRP
jgi:hypothetical protein